MNTSLIFINGFELASKTDDNFMIDSLGHCDSDVGLWIAQFARVATCRWHAQPTTATATNLTLIWPTPTAAPQRPLRATQWPCVSPIACQAAQLNTAIALATATCGKWTTMRLLRLQVATSSNLCLLSYTPTVHSVWPNGQMQ